MLTDVYQGKVSKEWRIPVQIAYFQCSLFGIHSSNSESEKDKILDVFVKVFNEMRGYCTEYPFLADLEKKLDKEGIYDEFKSTFKSINGDDWEEDNVIWFKK